MNIIITMAGLGSRFRAVGYQIPKYEIRVRGLTLFSWSLNSLRNFVDDANHFIFVCLRETQAQHFIKAQVNDLGIANWSVIQLDQLTDGQATSALLAAPSLTDFESPCLIYNIDTYVEPEFLHPSQSRGDGWIPSFEGEGDAWSFVKLGADHRVVEVREKQRISPYATVGLYGFSSFALYRETYLTHFSDPANLVRGERYIAPMYNRLILKGHPVSMTLIPRAAVHPLGTPEDVARFSAQTK